MTAAATASSTDLIPKIESALTAALTDIFSTMFNQTMKVIPVSDITDVPRLSAIIGFTGRLSGVMCLHLSSLMACNIASGLLATPIAVVDGDVRDAVGELSNMLAGNLKKQLSNTDNMFKMSIPSVIEGTEYSMHAPAEAHQVWMGVAAGDSRFKIQLVLQDK